MGPVSHGMGIGDLESTPGPAFSRDILRIDVEGPSRPQLTLVDIPGLIQSTTKGITEVDIEMVAGITDYYVQQSRTICLAVLTAQNDPANQGVLRRVRKYDPKGDRTLGIITKPDTLSAGSKSETEFLELAKNENVVLKLGWHVVKNRAYSERDFTDKQRALTEKTFFRDSIWKALDQKHTGVDNLRVRLSHLLFNHAKKELPRLGDDVTSSLQKAKHDIAILGNPRVTTMECRMYLAQLTMACEDVCKGGIEGSYHNEFFRLGCEEPFHLESTTSTRRLRAMVQFLNTGFASDIRTKGHKYKIDVGNDVTQQNVSSVNGQHSISPPDDSTTTPPSETPSVLSGGKAMTWARNWVLKCRGKELAGSFNPNVVAELFWEQSDPWEKIAKDHVERIIQLCRNFLKEILSDQATPDVKDRYWLSLVENELQKQRTSAFKELDQLIQDKKDYPINYNHYFTDNLQKSRKRKIDEYLKGVIPEPAPPIKCSLGFHYGRYDVNDAHQKVVSAYSQKTTTNMDDFSCEEALDHLMAIYKVQEKTFVSNVTTQVVERHIMKKLKDIFSYVKIIELPDSQIESIVSEPLETKRERLVLQDRIKKLEEADKIFRNAIGLSSIGSC